MTSPLVRTVARLLLFCLVGALLGAFTEVSAQQVLRPQGTFYAMPRLGLSHYYGDRTAPSPLDDMGEQAFGRTPPLAGGLELGYRLTHSLEVGLATFVGNYPFAVISNGDPADFVEKPSTYRYAGELLVRYRLGGRQALWAPFATAGVHVMRGYTSPSGQDRTGFGPALGVGFDYALGNQTSLVVEVLSNAEFADDAVDGNAANANSPAFDLFNFYSVGFVYRLRSAFTPADVLSLDCPAEPLDVGETATFTAVTNDAEATGPVTYRWDFGGGGRAEGLAATRRFHTAGLYEVTFTARNARSDKTEGCLVTINEPPTPAQIVTLNASPNRFKVCELQTVQFSADVQGDAPAEYRWYFGDGELAHGPNPTHVYESPGTYAVTLEVANETGSDARSLTITAEPCEPEICKVVAEMNPVFFGRNSATLTAEARAALRENMELFAECPNLYAEMVGYAVPGERNPQELAARRARAVEAFYVDSGVSAGRFEIGHGHVNVSTSKKDGASLYRRVDTSPRTYSGR